MINVVYKSDVIDPASRQAVGFDNLSGQRQPDELALTALALAGHPLGQAFAKQHGADSQALMRRWRPTGSLPFNPSHKYQAHLYNHPTAATSFAFVSGAPEVLLEKSRAPDAATRHQLLQAINNLAGQYHVVGIATRRHLHASKLTRSLLNNLELLGVLLIEEHLRPALPQNIDKLFTGDHSASAARLARQLGLIANPDVHLSAEALEQLEDYELVPLLPRLNVFSRLDQLHSQRLARLYGLT